MLVSVDTVPIRIDQSAGTGDRLDCSVSGHRDW